MNTEILAWVFFGLFAIGFVVAATWAVSLKWELDIEKGKHEVTWQHLRKHLAQDGGESSNSEAGAVAATASQPIPKGQGPDITPLVIADLRARSEAGTAKYGEPLRARNGRDALVDAYQEALDLCQYLRQWIAERDGA